MRSGKVTRVWLRAMAGMPRRTVWTLRRNWRWVGIVVCGLLEGCGGSGGTMAAAPPTGRIDNQSLVALDEPIVLRFDRPFDPATVAEVTLTIEALVGPGVGSPVLGEWQMLSGLQGGFDGIAFVPALPEPGPQPTRGGLCPATGYALRVLGGDVLGALRFADGSRLPGTGEFRFTTRSGSSAAQLFRSARPGGPRVTNLTAAPLDAEGLLRLGRLGDHTEIRIRFDQPLDPRESNLPPAYSTATPVRVRYDDPEHGPAVEVPVACFLERNAVDGAELIVRPLGVLPSAAALRVSIEPTLRDLFGEIRGAGEPTEVATWHTEPALAPQWDAITLDFADPRQRGPNDFGEVPAIVEAGWLRVPDPAENLGALGDWVADRETVLNTDVQTLHFVDAPPQTFHGGVFKMRNLHVPAGCIVRAVGSKPLVFVVEGEARIDGVIDASGSNDSSRWFHMYAGPADRPIQDTPRPLIVPAGPAGGSGARHLEFEVGIAVRDGSPAPGTAGTGGRGGLFGCGTCRDGSGAGGGAMATQGDPWFPAAAFGTSFVQRTGSGGLGCVGASGSPTRTLAGGAAGQPVFTDADPGNDFWGSGYDPRTARRVHGELPRPVGGGGGGAGGYTSYTGSCDESAHHGSGGGGGGGGGVVVLQARGSIHIGRQGRITAEGGHGYMPVRYVVYGGGGGGAGGMVVLMAGERITIEVHGETMANADYEFALSADGGICRRLDPLVLADKYPANGLAVVAGSVYDQQAMGGFGGMGIVQLMAPIGTDNRDGTNTVLDDNIEVRRDGLALQGADKQRYLGWQGTPDANGTWLDDFGNPTGTAGGMGDIRPAPILLPSPLASNGRARARSRWLPLGASVRRPLSSADGAARGVVGEGLAFASHGRPDGWLPWQETTHAAVLQGPSLLAAPATVSSITTTSLHGRPALRVDLATPLLGDEPDRHAGSWCALRSSATILAERRVLANDRDTLWLTADEPAPDGVLAVQLHAWCVDMPVRPASSYAGADGRWLPNANARLGFAFHRQPGQVVTGSVDPDRYPSEAGTFLYDLGAPGLSELLRQFRPTHLMWDVTLDGRFAPQAGIGPPTGRPEVLSLRRGYLQYRF